MRRQHKYWVIRENFTEQESDNLFYSFTEDHQIGFLWSDDDLNAVMAQHFNDKSYDKIHIQSLMRKGYFHVLRCMRREKASFAEKTGLLSNIEKAINEDRDSKDELLAYLHSFCDAIDYYSPDEKVEIQKHGRIRSLICFLSVICVTAILGLTIQALMNPESFFPISHMYAYDYWGGDKLIDVAYQYNKVQGITFYDKQGNVKTKLSDWNSWGTRELTVHEPASESAGERNVYFSDGSAVPTMIDEESGEDISLTVHYKPNGKISYTDEKDSTELENGFRYVYYSDDGTDITVRLWNGEETRYYTSSALEPLYSYAWTQIEEENEENFQIIFQDSEGATIYTNDMEVIRKEDSSLRIIKDTLGNGTLLNYYAIFYDRAFREFDNIFFPSESLFMAHPESEKEYEDGRLIKETWGPMPEYRLAYYEYEYEGDTLTSIREYVIPYAYEATVYHYETIPVYRHEYKVNAQGHITEIISHDPNYDPYYYNIEYGDNSKIMKISVYYDFSHYGSEEPEFYYSYSCKYANDGTLDSIQVDDKDGIPKVILLVDSEDQIVDYKVIEVQQ